MEKEMILKLVAEREAGPVTATLPPGWENFNAANYAQIGWMLNAANYAQIGKIKAVLSAL